MRVLVTGSEGYIGSCLGPYLINKGHDVTGLDTCFYRAGWLYHPNDNFFPMVVNQDIREVTVDFLKGFDAVIHLADLSNDALGQFSPVTTIKINFYGSCNLAEKCKIAGVKRFVYSSSCSVYGVGNEETKDEESALNPQTTYALCKVLVEEEVAKLSDDSFTTVFLRNATVYGASPRMRFDLVLNNLAGRAFTEHRIVLTSDGSPWRPMVHILDVCQAFALALEAPEAEINNQKINVGNSEHNYQIREIGKVVSEVFKCADLTFGENGGDNRSYRVSFEKIKKLLPGFQCRFNIISGAEELLALFGRISLIGEIYNYSPYTRLRHLSYLLDTGQLDQDLYWKGKRR
ncbi:MAG: NAD-dependent epimerase/dehydratase family protein [Bacillota bacterium]|jgi:nucleoside-diphosphate-sugar epimerase